MKFTAFAEFFHSKTTSARNNPGRRTVARDNSRFNMRGISLKIWFTSNQNFHSRHSGIEGVLPGAPGYTLISLITEASYFRGKAKSNLKHKRVTYLYI